MSIFNRHSTILCTAAISFLLTLDGYGQGGSWTTKAPMPTPRQASAAAVVGGILYVMGGSTGHLIQNSVSLTEAYDPKTNTWTAKAPMPTPRCCMAAGVVDGVIYVAGGYGRVGALPTLEVYDPKTNAWTIKAPMPTPRYGLAGGAVDGILYAVGGFYPGYFNENYDTVEAYDPKSDTWTTKAPMPTARGFMASAVMDGLIYVTGGFRTVGREGTEFLASVEVFDPKTNTWSAKPPIPAFGAAHVSGTLGGKLFVVGGNPYDLAYAYDVVNNSWATVPPLPTKRGAAVAGVVDDVFYVVGGIWGIDALAVNEAFDPFLRISIDIKPGDPDNTINLKSRGVVPVAILGSATFDPTTVDAATVRLAGAPVATRGRGVPMTSVADVNGDGYLDLLLHFRTQSLQLTSASTEAVLYGETFSGQRLRGADSVRIVAHGRLLGFGSLTEGPRAHAARAPN